MSRKRYPTEIAAWAAFDPRGNIAYATIKPIREAAEEAAERLSPTVEGYPSPLRVLPVFIGLDLNTQLSMLDGK